MASSITNSPSFRVRVVIKLVVFDLAGTTVDDVIDNLPLVTVAMKDSFRTEGFEITPEDVNKVRGLEKKEAVMNILRAVHERLDSGENPITCHGINSDLKLDVLMENIFKEFKVSLDHHLSAINKEIPGSTETFEALKSRGTKIAVGSGFPHKVVETIVDKLGWSKLVDYVSSAEKEGHGRPNPTLINSAMKHCEISDPRSVIKVGDTKADIEEGKNAGCITVAVLTGTQTEQTLRGAKPDHIIQSVAELPQLIQTLELEQV